MFISRTSRAFDSLLKDVWTNLLPYPQIRWYEVQTGSKVKFAKSRLRNRRFEEFTAWRSLIRGQEPSWVSTKVLIKSQRFLHSFEKEINYGEDPRLFKFRNEPHAMIQIFDESERDVQIRILNLKNGLMFDLHSPFGFNGKNWVPFEFQGRLHFLYALSPKVILVLRKYGDGNSLEKINSIEKFNPVWEHNLEESIGIYRGGSPALQIEPNNYFGFSHAINPEHDIHAHRLGIFSLTMPDQVLTHRYLTEYKESFLVDAYGLQKTKGQVLLDGSMAIGDIHDLDSQILNFRMYFELSQVKALLGIGGRDNDKKT